MARSLSMTQPVMKITQGIVVFYRIPFSISVRWRQDESRQSIVREHHMTLNVSFRTICSTINLYVNRQTNHLCTDRGKRFVLKVQPIYLDLQEINDTS
jgi:hypothetical protein